MHLIIFDPGENEHDMAMRPFSNFSNVSTDRIFTGKNIFGDDLTWLLMAFKWLQIYYT